jgi:Gpi18-like mannosyltransferase
MGKKSFAKVFLIALLAVCFSLRFYSGYKQYAGDVNNHIGWAQELNQNGFAGFYERTIPDISVPNYPPLAMFSFAFSEGLYQRVLSIFMVMNKSFGAFPSGLVWWIEQKNSLAMFMKIPAIAGDALLAFGVFLFARDIYKSKKAVLWSFAILINPALYYVSAVWGQIESLVMGLVLLSAYLGLQKKTFLSIMFFAFAALTKQTALWMLPIFFLLWIKDPIQTIKGIIGSLLFSFLVYLPFYGVSLRFLGSYITTLSGSSNVTSDKAYNLWYFTSGMVSDSKIIGFLSIRTISLLLLAISFLAILVWYKKNETKTNLIKGLYLLSLSAFFLQTRVHERHLYPAVVLQMLINNRSSIFGYIFLSIYFMVNLYWSLGLSFF